MEPAQIVLLGGFPGAGKTTLLAQAARRFFNRGRRVGLITNELGAALVDTGMLRRHGFDVREVSGGNFGACFDEFVEAVERLRKEIGANTIIAESVGTGADLSATVLQPLRKIYGERYVIAPLSVVIDPLRLRQALHPGTAHNLPDTIRYLYLKQLEEADVIVINKIDRLTTDGLDRLKLQLGSVCPTASVIEMAARTGLGLNAWLSRIATDRCGGQQTADVDYHKYAKGESSLGWLNAAMRLRAWRPTDWHKLCEELLRASQTACSAQQAEIAHVKLLLNGRGTALVGNVTDNTEEPSVRGQAAEPPEEAAMTMNARVHADPATLQTLLREAVRKVAGQRVQVTFATCQAFSPEPAAPQYRVPVAN